VWAKWRGLMAEHGDSGLSASAFCRQRGLRVSQFYGWRKRLRQSSARQFLEVQVLRTPEKAVIGPGRAIEIRLADGRRIVVEPGFDPNHLRAVVAALEMRG
jgi:transposase-like protein